MTKIIWLSDLHYVRDGTVQGHDPRLRLTAAIDHINAHHADADFCVISGDIVDRATKEDYAAVAAALRLLAIPVHPMVGNHDDRALFRDHLPLPSACMNDFVQFAVPTPDGLLICLDTLMVGSDAGEVCAERQAWLQDTLENAGDAPVYVFMHHPPHALGLPMQDADRIGKGTDLLNLLSGFHNVQHLFIGHVHRAIAGTVNGIPFTTIKSALYQAPAPHPAWNWSSFKPAKEAPTLGVITIQDGSFAIHFNEFCNWSFGVNTP